MPVFRDWMNATRPDREVELRRKGESLFLQGDSSDYFYVVKEGRILFVKESPFGTPLVLERLLPGDFVAGFAVIFDFPYPAGAIADCPSKAVGYAKKNLHLALERDRELRREVNTELGERFRMYQSRLLYAHMPIEVRLSQALVALSGRSPDSAPSDAGTKAYRDSIAITRTVLAFMPSLARSLSFILSLLALWALILRQSPLAEKNKNGKGFDSPLQSFRSGILITLFTTPLLALVFRTASPAGIVANPVLVPIAGDLLLPLGFFDLFLRMLLPHTPWVLVLLTGALSHAVLGLAAGFASLPGSALTLPRANPLLVLLFYLAIFLLMISSRPSIRRSAPLLLFLFCAALLIPGSPEKKDPALALSTTSSGPPRYRPERERENLTRLLGAHFKDKILREEVQ